MRLAEDTPFLGCVLVAACHTDLGDEHERLSGYYSRPWYTHITIMLSALVRNCGLVCRQWEQIKSNTKWILQYHSLDDRLIPIAEADHVAAHLGSEYTRAKHSSHFFHSRHIKPVFEAVCARAAKTA
jgi:hypothetical protein